MRVYLHNFTIIVSYTIDSCKHENIVVKTSWLKSPADGCTFLGLFSSKFIPCGTKIAQYVGTIMRTVDALRLQDKSYLMRLGEQKYIDAKLSVHCIARYINDCRNPAGYNVRFDKDIENNCAWVVAIRDIQPDEELFIDYGKWYW